MTVIARKCLFAILALVVVQGAAQANSPCCQPCGADALCRVPLTKSYRVQPGFCPQQLASMIANCVPARCADCCGPQGIPPIYTAGNYVLVRQTPEVHEQVAKYLTDLGAYVPPQPKR